MGVGEAAGVGVGVGFPATGVGVGVGLEELTLPHPVMSKMADKAINEKHAHRANFINLGFLSGTIYLLLRQ